MNFENFVIESILKKTDRQEVSVICDQVSGQRYVRRIIKEDKRHIYKVLQKINHVNIPKIIDVSLTDSTVVIEEFVNGRTLAQIMDSRKKLPYKKIKSIAKQLAAAMEALHKSKIIHKDIKPDNIIMDDDGHIWLIDYEIARIYTKELKKDTELLGTVGYAPVEQFGMMPTDYKTDIYAFGATVMQILEYSHKKGRLYSIAQKCKRLDPSQRYKSTKNLQRALKLNPIIPISIILLLLLIGMAVTASIRETNKSREEQSEKARYDEYLGTWRDESGMILEMLMFEGNTAKFNLKQIQDNGSIRSIDNVTGIVEGDEIEFSYEINDSGDKAEGMLEFDDDSIDIEVSTDNENTSASINADTTLKRDILIKINGKSVQLDEKPPIMLDENIFVPADDFPRNLKLDSYYDSGFWAGEYETRITVMNNEKIAFFTNYDDIEWELYITDDENVQTSYSYEYEQISIISQQPAFLLDTVYIPLEILVDEFGGEMNYDEEENIVEIEMDTSGNCKSETEIAVIEEFNNENAYDIARIKYPDILGGDGMPHYNHKGKYFMFITAQGGTAFVYDNGVIELN